MQGFPGIPVTRQGNPLPAEFGYEGEWLHQPHLFLYRPLAGQSQADDTRMTAGFTRSNG